MAVVAGGGGQRLDVVIFWSKSCIISPFLSTGTGWGAKKTVSYKKKQSETVPRVMIAFPWSNLNLSFFAKSCAKINLEEYELSARFALPFGGHSRKVRGCGHQPPDRASVSKWMLVSQLCTYILQNLLLDDLILKGPRDSAKPSSQPDANRESRIQRS